MRSVALLLSCSLTSSLLGGCFPHNSKHRTYAQLAEGGALVAGIGILTFSGTSADCDVKVIGMADDGCRTSASIVGNIGLGLIIAGLVGFIATVSTAEDDKPTPPTPPTPTPTPTPTMQRATSPAPAPDPAP